MANSYTAAILVAVVYFGNAYGCSDSWVGHNGMCYLFSHDTENWIGALQMCREVGAQLVEIETAAENTYLKAQIQIHAKDQFWMALNDVSEEGTWQWMNSKAFLTATNFTDWFPGQPDNHAMDQNCAAFYVNTHHTTSWQWSDVACVTRNHYICEKADESGGVIG